MFISLTEELCFSNRQVSSAVYSMAVADEGAVYVGLEKGYIVRMDKK